MLCAIPAIRNLRRAFPGSEITWIGLPWGRSFAARFSSYLDRFVEFPGYPGLPEQEPPGLERLTRFMADMRQRRFDLLLQMHGDGRLTNGIVSRMGARKLAGFCPAEGPQPLPADGQFFLPYPETMHEIHRHLQLMRFLGVERLQGGGDDELEFPLSEADRREAARLLAGYRVKSYVCVHPGAREESRRWRVDGFAGVAEELSARGFDVLVTGSARERVICSAVASAVTRTSGISLAGETSLGALASLILGSQLVVCNDTGVSHLACAVGARSVVVFTGSDPARWAPLDPRLHRTCIRPASAREVLDEVGSVLKEKRHAA